MSNDRNLFISLAFVLLGFGVMMVHSASITSWPTEYERVYLSRHLAFAFAGVVAAVICSVIPGRFWYRMAPAIFIVTAILLVLVAIPGIGSRVNGARRWLRYGDLSLQPSELAKIAIPLLMARLLVTRHGKTRDSWWRAACVILPSALIIPLVAIEPDLGTSVFLLAVTLVALIVGAWPVRYFVGTMACAVPAGVCFSLFMLKPYQLARLTGFVDAWRDVSHAPWQVKQSLVSLGAGGIPGVGIGRGWQKLSYLPEANTDFVFAVVGEELGLIGTLGIVTLWCGLFLTGIRLLRNLPERSFALVAGTTLLAQLVLQAAINVAVATAMLPNNGLALPLISYGGSNLVTSMVCLGIIISLSTAKPGIDTCWSPALTHATFTE